MGDAVNGVAAQAERFAIGISFGNSYSSIARISAVRRIALSLIKTNR
jgi:hypothetical protein